MFFPGIRAHLLCLLFGHKWVKDKEVDTFDPYARLWRPARYCVRCLKTEDP